MDLREQCNQHVEPDLNDSSFLDQVNVGSQGHWERDEAISLGLTRPRLEIAPSLRSSL